MPWDPGVRKEESKYWLWLILFKGLLEKKKIRSCLVPEQLPCSTVLGHGVDGAPQVAEYRIKNRDGREFPRI